MQAKLLAMAILACCAVTLSCVGFNTAVPSVVRLDPPVAKNSPPSAREDDQGTGYLERGPVTADLGDDSATILERMLDAENLVKQLEKRNAELDKIVAEERAEKEALKEELATSQEKHERAENALKKALEKVKLQVENVEKLRVQLTESERGREELVAIGEEVTRLEKELMQAQLEAITAKKDLVRLKIGKVRQELGVSQLK